ncbi:neither inactivation nor afterpotential protein C-like [Centruroides sculpturatus]|uniref:neither inactivation nor afterpotential protein C-like n=1 Tax=Centruroides sculpturatus TaxID=218467 RepID=UPI000C6D4D24|nr:neither inactivation nor afterpotential protein C-like [Centruroides sculpturatus]
MNDRSCRRKDWRKRGPRSKSLDSNFHKRGFDATLDFPFIQDENTLQFFQKSKIMIILRGLPGSGKSYLANRIKEKYGKCCFVCSADHFFECNGEYNFDPSRLKEAHHICKQKSIQACKNGKQIIVIDNCNICIWEFKYYLSLADENGYVQLIIEPKTPWKFVPGKLASKNTHGLRYEILERKLNQWEYIYPLYFAWFINEEDSYSLKRKAIHCFNECLNISEFAMTFRHLMKNPSKEFLQYFGLNNYSYFLHCTSKYCGRNNELEAKRYLDEMIVQNEYETVRRESKLDAECIEKFDKTPVNEDVSSKDEAEQSGKENLDLIESDDSIKDDDSTESVKDESKESAAFSNENQENLQNKIPYDRSYSSEFIDFTTLSYPENKLKLLEIIGEGTTSVVYSAEVTETGRKVAVKIVKDIDKHMSEIEAEYRVFSIWGDHFYLPDFFGIFLNLADEPKDDELWIVMELCTGGTVSQLVKCLKSYNKTLTELQIAYILKEIIQAVASLHENDIIHRDIRASNLYLTETGDIRLGDFGISYQAGCRYDTKVRIGSPHWMAPEVVTCGRDYKEYDNRCDVWSLGILTLELAFGEPPAAEYDSLRYMIQTARNPPPSLPLLYHYSEQFRDFVSECLTVYFDFRPYSIELLDHPFITQLPKNDSHIATELKILCEVHKDEEMLYKADHIIVIGDKLRTDSQKDLQVYLPDDVVSLDNINQASVLELLKNRFLKDQIYTYIGEMLIFVNPYKMNEIYDDEIYHKKYQEKAFIDNSPHLYAMADQTYQDLLHHKKLQTILLMGESESGKSTAAEQLFNHLIYLGSNTKSGINDKLLQIFPIMKAFGCCTTPSNDSYRFSLHLEMTFSNMGKVTSAILSPYLLETEIVVCCKRNYSNYHIFYYVYEGLKHEGKLQQYGLSEDAVKHRYLNTSFPVNSLQMYEKLKESLKILTFTDEDILMIVDCIAAIILIGDIEFMQVGNVIKVSNKPILENIADFLGIKAYHLRRIVTCQDVSGNLNSTIEMSERCRDSLAKLIYSRLFDWVINEINKKLSFCRMIYGDVYSIAIIDFFGLENQDSNESQQLWHNLCFEQVNYFYKKYTFTWEQEECKEEEVTLPYIQVNDGREVLDTFLSRTDGLLQALHIACRHGSTCKDRLIDILSSVQKEHMRIEDDYKILVNHTNEKITYDLKELIKCSKCLSEEVISTLASSRMTLIKNMFSSPLTKTGQLKDAMLDEQKRLAGKKCRTGLMSIGCISQEKLALASSVLIVRQNLSVMMKHLVEGDPHFIFCLRSNKNGAENCFEETKVSKQLDMFNINDLGRLRMRGFSHRISFEDFLKRYQYLAFDFNETVDVTANNCKLCLLRLKLDGWHIGKSKVFLKYYHVQYLSRLYENEIRKIIKVQAAMRRFLTVCKHHLRMEKKSYIEKKEECDRNETKEENNEDEKNETQIKDEKEETVEKVKEDAVDHKAARIIQYYYKRWRLKSIFQVLQNYRMAKATYLVQFCQQVTCYITNNRLY